MITKEDYLLVLQKALLAAEKARREGLLACEEDIDREKYDNRDIFQIGMTLIVDGTDPEFVKTILTNLVNQEADPDKKLIKTMELAAVLSIQEGNNPRLLILSLNSISPFTLAETREWLPDAANDI
jgi:flagellar motor component MotA